MILVSLETLSKNPPLQAWNAKWGEHVTPVIWNAYVMLCRDIEKACGEKVISELDESSRKEYSFALLNCSVKHKLIKACPVAFGETDVKSRIKAIIRAGLG